MVQSSLYCTIHIQNSIITAIGAVHVVQTVRSQNWSQTGQFRELS